MMGVRVKPEFTAERTGVFSFRYRPANEAAIRVCRLAKRDTLSDEEIKLASLLGLECNIRELLNENF